ncbi:phage tail sheath C-terminal domain-containing protein [Kosakonia sp. BYX6]|uniref:Phage tail sheath C-terminal domain-containing protein n=1 Tax=Kosakonia calanthes TaxID=3139408 RepID=A0ABZ3B7I7_9ENTR
MATTTSYPGVYLSEEAVSNFVVSSAATAVPAFAFRKYAWEPSHDGNIFVFNNWAEFLKGQHGNEGEFTYAVSIKLWFMNGGGKCYLFQKSYLDELLNKYDDITLVVAAGTETDIFNQITNFSNRSGYQVFHLLDSANSKIGPADTQSTIMTNYPVLANAAVFYPWGKSQLGNDIPPSAMAAAAIAQADSTLGVWKAPANLIINGVASLKYPVSDDLQGRFNQGKALNMFREYPGSGVILWGARTLEDSDNWRYIPVRRLFNMIETDVRRSLNKVVFETNNPPTWQRVKSALNNYLYSLWQQGALVGNSPQEAWFVEVGKGITMTEGDINQGKLIINLGLAAVRPAEFILLQFSQDIAQ